MRRITPCLLGTAACVLVSTQANASLLGSQVTGSLTFGANPLNYFDPGNGFVPINTLNHAAGTTVTVIDPGIEFGFDDGNNRDTADFAAHQVTIEDKFELPFTTSDNPWEMKFTDTLFLGGGITISSSSFPGTFTATVNGDTVTVDWSGGTINPGDDFIAVITGDGADGNGADSVPEPATLSLFGLALAGLSLVRRKVT